MDLLSFSLGIVASGLILLLASLAVYVAERLKTDRPPLETAGSFELLTIRTDTR